MLHVGKTSLVHIKIFIIVSSWAQRPGRGHEHSLYSASRHRLLYDTYRQEL